MLHYWLARIRPRLILSVAGVELLLFAALILWLWVQLSNADGTGGAAAYVYFVLGILVLVLPACVGGWTFWKNKR